MAQKKYKCNKCGRVFDRAQAKGVHEKHCTAKRRGRPPKDTVAKTAMAGWTIVFFKNGAEKVVMHGNDDSVRSAIKSLMI